MTRGGALGGCLLLGLTALPSLAHGQVRGFGEVRFQAMPGVDGTWWTLVERVRPTFEGKLHDRVRLVATLEAGLSQGRRLQDEFQAVIDDSDFAELLDLAECSWPEPEQELLRIEKAGDYLAVDRLYLDVYLPFVDLRVGRQTIHWGSAQFMNPTDPFPEVLLAEPWRPRKGVNAVRATFPLPEGGDITAVLGTTDLFDALRIAGRARFRLDSLDLAVTGAYRGDVGEDGEALVGLDLRGTLGVGYWLETSLHLGHRNYAELAAGLDYSFPLLERLIVMGQYYFNGAGAKAGGEPASAAIPSQGVQPPECGVDLGESGLFASSAAEPDPFAPTLGGRHYVLLSASLGILPELSVSLAGLQNLSDGTGLFLPTVTALPLEWLEIAVSAQVPYRMWGEGGEFKPNEDDLVIEQDLGPLFGVRKADFSGLLPDAVITVWTRASF